MHENLLTSDDIDYNLYPALLQVFVLVLIGYIAGACQILSKSQVMGINRFVSTFALPALLFKSIVVLDFSSVNWLFLTSIFLSKSTVFFGAILITLITIRPLNIGMAAVFAIYVSQSNDFALGYPIVSAIYSQTHPDYLHYIYLIAPISLVVLNPIAFLMMEANEVIYKRNQAQLAKRKKNNTLLNSSDSDFERTSLIETYDDKNDDDDYYDENEKEDGDDENQDCLSDNLKKRLIKRKTRNSKINLLHINNSNNIDTINHLTVPATTSNNSMSSSASTNNFRDLLSKSKKLHSSNNHIEEDDQEIKLSKLKLIKTTLWATISNPIVFMTLIGLIANFILKQKIPFFIDPILTALSNSFSALALFYLGFTMVGKIKGLSFKTIVIILILVFSKSLVFPLIAREIVLHLENSSPNTINTNSMNNDTDSLSSFAFLYGTFPAAPSLFFYITRYKSLSDDLISSALVFGTLASAPLMMISGKMISLKYSNSSVSNFEDIECKTAYGFSILNWFCCIWVLYVFMASGRFWRRSHRFTTFLVLSQMINSAVHIIWSSLTVNVENLAPGYGYAHVAIGLFTAYLTRCWVLAILLNLITLCGTQRYGHFRTNTFLLKLGSFKFIYYMIGIGVPVIVTFLCMIIGGIPEKQKMMISIGKPQIIISNVLLFLLIISIFYLLIVFARTKTNQDSLITFIRTYNSNKRTNYNSLISNGSLLNKNESGTDDNDETTNNQGEHSIEINEENDNETSNLSDDSVFKKLSFLNEQYQLIQHISLIIILVFNFLMCLFFQMWILFDESKSGIFYELELLDTTLLYGQGFFTFLAFGFDNNLIFAPFVFKIKEIFKLIEPLKLPPIENVPLETLEICKKFKEKYLIRFSESIVKNHRFHHKNYIDVFTGNDFVEYALELRLVKNKKQAVDLGNKLIYGRVIQHVSKKRLFYDDGFNYYRFEQ